MKKIYNLLTKQLAILCVMLFSVSIASAQCPVGTTNVDVEYTQGTWANEDGWALYDATAGVTLACVGSATLPNFNGGIVTDFNACVTDGNVIELHTFERVGDGWCAPASITVTINESGAINGCAMVNTVVFAGVPPVSGNGNSPACAVGPAASPGGVVAATFSTTCVVPSCEITCPDDINISNDPGVCGAFVELPEPELVGACVETAFNPVDFGSPMTPLMYNAAGLITTPFSIGGITAASCVTASTMMDLTITVQGDFGFFTECAEIWWCPGGVPTTFLGIECQPTANDCNSVGTFTIQAPGSVIVGGVAEFCIVTDPDVDAFCNPPNFPTSFIAGVLAVPSECTSYDITGASPDGNYPVGTTCVTYTATGSGTGSGEFPQVSCTFKINITDDEDPVFVCPVDQTVTLQGGECCQIIDYTVSASDNCGLAVADVEPAPAAFEGCDPSGAAGSTFDMIYFDIQNNGSDNIILNEVNFPVWQFLGNANFAWEVYLTDVTSVGVETDASAWCLAGALPEANYVGGQLVEIPLTMNVDDCIAPSTGACGDTGFFLSPGQSVGVALGFPVQYTNAFGIEYVFGACTPPTNPDGLNLVSNGATTTAFAGTLLTPRGFIGDFDYSVVPASGGMESIVMLSGLESGSEFPIGKTTNSFTAEDCSGNIGECTFCVTVNELPESQIVTSLTCNDGINVSVDDNCEVYINADMFLEGSFYGCYFNCYEVYIKDEHGHVISSTCADPTKAESFPNKVRNPIDVNGCSVQLECGTYTYEVYDACNDNLCWGYFTVEDKIAPVLACPADYTVNCTESTLPQRTVNGVTAVTPDPSPMQWAATGTGGDLDYDFGPMDPNCTITDVNIQIVLDHGWVPDTEATLTSPAGTTVALWGGSAGVAPCFNPNNNNVNVIFDEDGAPFTCHVPSAGVSPDVTPPSDCDGQAYDFAVLGGSVDFGAMQTLSTDLGAFNGEVCGGVWRLNITDNFAFGQGGCLNESTLFVQGNGPGVPLLKGTFPTIVKCDDNTRNQTYVYEQSCAQETVRYTDRISGNGCDGQQIFRTWVATDDKDNTGACTQLITVESIGIDELDTDWFWPDMNVPTIACLDGSSINPDGDGGIHLTCGSDSSPEGIMKYYYDLYQACIPPPSPDAADYPAYRANLKRFARSKAFPYILGEEGCDADTYDEANDFCFETAINFMQNSCNMIFTYQDNSIPVCDTNCGGNNEKVIREWTALDWCTAETITKTQIIHSKDNEGPQVDLLAAYGVQSVNSITVSADPWGCVATFKIPAPEHLLDNCSTEITYTVNGPGVITYSNSTWSASGVARGQHAYTYTAVDCCGNEGRATLLVTVVDNTPPIAAAIKDIKIGMTYSPTNPEGASTKVYVDQIDNGSNDGQCGNVKVAIRRIDEDESCLNIGVNGHNNNKTFFNVPGNPDAVQNPLNHDKDDTDGGQFVKFCCNDLFNEDFEGGDLDGDGVRDYVIIPVELGVWDDADGDGWPGSSFADKFAVTWANVRIEAQVKPTLVCPPTAAIECELDENNDIVIDAYLGRATASSYCGVLDVQYEDVCGWDQNEDGDLDDDYFMMGMTGPETFNKACHYGPIVRTWSIPGTESTCEQIILVKESNNYFSGSYYLLDDNGDYILQPNGRPIENDYVTFPYESDAVDVENDDFDDFSELELDCEDGMLGAEPSWVAESCGLIGMTLESDTVRLEGDACVKIINKYCVIDWCQYDPNSPGPRPSNGDMKGNAENPGKWCWTVIGKLRDTEAPTVTSSDEVFPAQPGGGGSGGFPTSLNCVGTAQMSATAFDNGDCPSDWIKWVVLVDLYDDGTIQREYSSFVANDRPVPIPYWTDSNGNGIPDVRVGWGHGFDAGATGNGTSPGDTYTINIPDILPADCGETRHRVSWSAYDGCGNIASTTSYFTIEDEKAPTPYCVNLSTALMDIPVGGSPEDAMVELWAIDFDRGSFDNCTADDELRFTFEDDASTVIPEYRSAAKIFTCEDLAGGNPALLTLPIYVWDGCGNRDYCLVNLRLTDNNNACDVTTTGSRIAGFITNKAGETIEDVEVMNEQMPNSLMGMEMTDNIGHYVFEKNDLGMDYEVSASKNDDYLNGVSTIDLVMIQQHILGLNLLETPEQMIAADVNGDQAIDGRDLVELRKLILGIYTELPQNDSWRFIDADQDLEMNSPWTFSEILEIKSLANDMMKEDFIGVKIGDVNDTAIPNSAIISREIKSGNTIDIQFENVQVEVGQEVSVKVNANVQDLYGYQFTMATPGLQLVNVEAGELNVTEANFGVFNNVLTTSWNSTTGVSTSNNLFTMTFKSNVSGNLSEILGLNNSITASEAYVGSNLEIVDIALNNVTGSTEFALHQNEPNPFSTNTEIGFVMPAEGEATMTVYDVTGKVISVLNGNYPKGYNTIELSKSDLGASGVLYYQLDSGDFTATKKMIIIE